MNSYGALSASQLNGRYWVVSFRSASGEGGLESGHCSAYALPMSEKHNTIIATAAKVELGRLGFRQQGRSRLWLADHRSWLNVVEFTPDRWTKGVSLMNAAHWLWAGAGFLAFHESAPSKRHIGFETAEQFAGALPGLVQEAASKAVEMQERFSSLERTAQFAIDRARSSPDRMQPSWWGYEAGIASGLCGDFRSAETFLRGITDERVITHAAPLLPLIESPACFVSRVNELVDQQREVLKLPPLERPPF